MRALLGPLTLLSLLVLFLLPFVEFSCQGKPVMTLNGYDTAFGREVKAELPISKWLNEQDGRRRSDGDRDSGLNIRTVSVPRESRLLPPPSSALCLVDSWRLSSVPPAQWEA